MYFLSCSCNKIIILEYMNNTCQCIVNIIPTILYYITLAFLDYQSNTNDYRNEMYKLYRYSRN